MNIALICRGAPVLGVVHVPCSGRTYWAVKGKGAWIKEFSATPPSPPPPAKTSGGGATASSAAASGGGFVQRRITAARFGLQVG